MDLELGRGGTRAVRWVVAALLLVPAVVAAGRVMNTASGSYQVDVLGHVLLVGVVWLALPIAWLLTWRRVGRWEYTVVALAFVAAVATGFTAWVVRPQAPTGAQYPVSHSEAASAAERDLTAALDQVAPGQWKPTPRSEPWPCLDAFGRSRGAVYGGPAFEVRADLGQADIRRVEELTLRPGRSFEASLYGPAVELLGQDHETVVIRLETYEGSDEWIAEITTPCLREE